MHLPISCVVLLIVTMLEGLSGFGRTAALSPFLNDLCRDLSLSRTQISGAYSFAHLATMFLLPRIGRFFDRVPLSCFLRTFVILFSAAFIGMSSLANGGSPLWLKIGVLGLGYTFIRMSVHSYSIAGRSTIALWFSRRRGAAIGTYTLCTTIIGSAMPSMAYALQQRFSWSRVWFGIGALWFGMWYLCSFAKKPESNCSNIRSDSSPNEPSYRPVLFYFIMITLFFKAFQNTGIALHWMPMCHEFGANAKQVSFCFLPIAAISIGSTFIFGHFFKKIGAEVALFLFLIADVGMLCATKMIATTVGLCTFIGFNGLYWGLNHVVATLVLPLLFGVKNIGALHGWAYAFVSFGSSVGSFYFGWMGDHASYQFGLSLCIAFSLFLLLFLCTIRKQIRSIPR